MKCSCSKTRYRTSFYFIIFIVFSLCWQPTRHFPATRRFPIFCITLRTYMRLLILVLDFLSSCPELFSPEIYREYSGRNWPTLSRSLAKWLYFSQHKLKISNKHCINCIECMCFLPNIYALFVISTMRFTQNSYNITYFSLLSRSRSFH